MMLWCCPSGVRGAFRGRHGGGRQRSGRQEFGCLQASHRRLTIIFFRRARAQHLFAVQNGGQRRSQVHQILHWEQNSCRAENVQVRGE